MEDNNNTQAKSLLAGIILGGIVGATAALLLAPKSGKEIRRDLSRTYEDVSETAHDLAHSVSKKGHRYANNISGQAGEWTDKVKEFLDVVSDGVSHFSHLANKEASHIKDSAEENIHSKLQNVIDIASIGLNLWKSAGNKRR